MWRPKQLRRIWEGVNLAWLTCFAAWLSYWRVDRSWNPTLQSDWKLDETSREVWSHLIWTTCTVDVVQSFGIWHWTRQVRLWTDSLKSRGGGRILFGNRLVTWDYNDKAVYDCPLKVYTCQVDDSMTIAMWTMHRIPYPGSNLRDCGSWLSGSLELRQFCVQARVHVAQKHLALQGWDNLFARLSIV